MSNAPTYVTAREALGLFMQGHNPPLDDAAMGKLVGVSRTGITKIRNEGRKPSLALAATLESVTGIPACSWQPASEAQGRVAPAWLRIPQKAKSRKGAKRLKAA